MALRYISIYFIIWLKNAYFIIQVFLYLENVKVIALWEIGDFSYIR